MQFCALVNSLTRCTVTPFQVVLPVTKFSEETLKEQSEVTDRPRNMLAFPFSFPKLKFSSSEPSRNNKPRKLVKNNHIKSDCQLQNSKEQKKGKQRQKKAASSSSSAMNLSTKPPLSYREYFETQPKLQNAKELELLLPALQTVKKHNTLSVDFVHTVYQIALHASNILCHVVSQK